MSVALLVKIRVVYSKVCYWCSFPGMVIPDLLPCGYLVGDNTNITITLNGMFGFHSSERCAVTVLGENPLKLIWNQSCVKMYVKLKCCYYKWFPAPQSQQIANTWSTSMFDYIMLHCGSSDMFFFVIYATLKSRWWWWW